MTLHIRPLLVAIIALLCIPLSLRADDKPRPDILFETRQHDFGVITDNKGYVECEFPFTNNGNAPLVITNVKTSCGCTRPEYPLNPIPPGKSDKIKVKYNTNMGTGQFNRDIQVQTNVPGKKRIKLSIAGTVLEKE